MTKTDEAAIIKQHEKLLRSVALSFARVGASSIDDLMQEGRIALVLASRNWKADRGASIWTYARRFVVGAMFGALQDAIKGSSTIDPDQVDESVDSSLSPDERVVLCELLARLSPRELQVVRDLFFGETLEDVSTSLDLSVTHTHRIRETAHAKMRDAA